MAIPTGIRTNSKVTRAILILIAYSSLVFNFVPVKRYLFSENASMFPQKTAIKLILASHLHLWPVHLLFDSSSILKTPKQEQDENHYQDRSQNTTRGIAPTLAMRPGREGPHEQDNDNNDQYPSHFRLLLVKFMLVLAFHPVERYLVSENASLFPQKTAIKLILASHLMAVAPSPFIIVWVRKTRMPPTP
jgi:hypothetical protein